MKNSLVLALTCCLVASISSPRRSTAAAPQAGASTGSIKGRVRLSGKPPGNTIIRMGLDPKCTQINQGKRLLQETVVTSADGGLANVFVRLQGSFPPAPVPAEPVIIDQRGCVYHPRVIGARVGQTLEVRNSDALHHNVHSLSGGRNSFNEEQSRVGAVGKFRMNAEEIMLRLKCDVHSWMNAYVGVVSHPYFAVSNDTGAFEIAKVPAGTYTIQSWHERYGPLTQMVRVRAGAATTLDFAYTRAEKPPGRASIQDLNVPGDALTAALIGPNKISIVKAGDFSKQP